MSEQKENQVRLTDLENGVGKALELPPRDKARLTIACSVLATVAVIIILAGIVLLYGPDSRIEESKVIFEFVKTIAPPIVTLVIGFYFRNEDA